jgi:hypothetical protein
MVLTSEICAVGTDYYRQQTVVMLSAACPGFGQAESKHPYATSYLWTE